MSKPEATRSAAGLERAPDVSGARARPRFSVIMPVFNAADFFTDVLDSIPDGVDDDFEFILIDDCSTDGTAELIRRHRMSPRITLLRTPQNSGPATARNLGVARARAENLIFFDADVVFLPDTFTRVRDYVLAHPEVRCFTGMNSKESAAEGRASHFQSLWIHYTLNLIPENAPAAQWNPRVGFIRKDLFNEIGGFDTSYRKADVEDYALSKKIEQRTPIVFTRSFEIKHRFAGFRGTTRNFYKRSRQWMSLLRKTKSLDKTGHTRLGNLPNVVLPVLMVLCAALSPWIPAGKILLGLLISFLVINWDMTLFFIRDSGPFLTVYYLFLFLCYHLAAAAGIASWMAESALNRRAS